MSARAFALLLLASCSPIDVTIVSVPDGGADPRHGPPCEFTSDCGPEGFCERLTCDAPVGRCTRRPPVCDLAQAPVCGCNGVTYWNDCLRQAAGQTASVVGTCAVPASCNSSLDCADPQSSCARLVTTSTCPATVSGECWVVPVTCPASAPRSWAPCAGGGACVDFCAAVRAQTPQLRSTSCP